jgi:pyruvate dehydrogenase complex dehydrogenase (E1) component
VAEDVPGAGLLAITSPDWLHRDWRAARACGESGVAERLLALLRPGGALATVSDFDPATLSWLGAVAGNAIVPLGVDRFGQSGDIPDLYHAYGIDTDAILDAAARACLAARPSQLLGVCETIDVAVAVAEYSPRHPGEGRDPSFRRSEFSSNCNGLPTLAALVPRRYGPRPAPGRRENMRQGFLHSLSG